MLQLNYWRGPIDAWPFSKLLGAWAPGPPVSTPLADSLKLQLILTARKKEWWPAIADSLPQAAASTGRNFTVGLSCRSR